VLSGRITQATLRSLDWLAERMAKRRLTSISGSSGYTMVARNFRSPRCRGEIDLIGWDKDILCFVEVKTRSTRDVKPGEAAVDRHKRRGGGSCGRENTCGASHLRASGVSMWSAYTMGIRKPPAADRSVS
jgi:hypothetical protein